MTLIHTEQKVDSVNDSAVVSTKFSK